ncbi:hypothetical protein [Nocardia sp. NPDC056000]|uniref:hypothetical protein n=1 Tax=Nocardia sp. NPDC056000 TaxID=3345674 RepID=UPI0035D88C8F
MSTDKPYPINEIEFETTDKCGNKVILRRGYYDENSKPQGFGWDKINHKHKITNMDTVQQLVESTCGVPEKPGGSTLIYNKTIKMKDCSAWANPREMICTETDTEVTVKMVVETANPEGDGKQKGIITAFCEGTVECPSWVSREGFVGTVYGQPLNPDDPGIRPQA